MLAVFRDEEGRIHVFPWPLYLHYLDSVAFGLGDFVVKGQFTLCNFVEIVMFSQSVIVDAVYRS